MQYTKPMIDLVFQIRREAPESYRPKIKFANPELLSALKSMSDEVEDGPLTAAVERLLNLVNSGGQPDTARHEDPPLALVEKTPARSSSPSATRVYRGQRVAG